MILPDFFLSTRQNCQLDYTGLDSREQSPDPEYFDNYPYPITYQFNSRGFRDAEWPDTVEQLKKSIWCVGDSFTVGIGVNYEHTWPRMLEQQLGRRVIKVAMDGASNNWIARKAQSLIQNIDPDHIILHWSFLHRRELPDSRFNDEYRRVYNVKCTPQDDIDNFKQCLQVLGPAKKVIHSFIPEFAPAGQIEQVMSLMHGIDHVPYFPAQDRGRDSLHYGPKTTRVFVDQLITELA
jgi:hypothetical protein